jgi:trk system potassium uptake protein TrkA
MNILIVGCGNVGVCLARILSGQGHDVAVVDRSQAALQRLGPDFEGIAISGIPVDQDVLRSAGIESCDAVMAVTADDNLNLMVSQIAQQLFHVRRVITRVLDIDREDVFSRFGLSTVCPTRLTAAAMLSALEKAEEEQLMQLGASTFSFSTHPVPRGLRGRTILQLKQKKDEQLFGIRHANGSVTLSGNVADSYLFTDEDQLIFVRTVD